MTTKKPTKSENEKPEYEPPIVSYYTLQAAGAVEPEPDVIPTTAPTDTAKEN